MFHTLNESLLIKRLGYWKTKINILTPLFAARSNVLSSLALPV
jgi:hypothetical protein